MRGRQDRQNGVDEKDDELVRRQWRKTVSEHKALSTIGPCAPIQLDVIAIEMIYRLVKK